MNRLLLSILLLLMVSNAQASQSSDDLVDEGYCRIVAPEGYLNAFWRSAQALDMSEPVSVLHLGDSHVQAGVFSEPVRESLQYIIGDGGVGWVGPYRLLGTNQPQHTSLTSRSSGWRGDRITSRVYDSYSPTGIVLRSISRQSQSITVKGVDGGLIQSVIVLRRSGSPSVCIQGGEAHRSSPITHIEADTIFLAMPRPEVTLTIPPASEIYGVILRGGESGVLLHTIGYNGAFFSTFDQASFLKGLDGVLKPRLIILSLGTNESLARQFSRYEFGASVSGLVRSIRREIPDAMIVLTTPLYTYTRNRRSFSKNQNTEMVAEEIIRQAEALGCGYIDLFSAFGGARGAEQLVQSGILSPDRVHLTHEGYKMIGQAVGRALSKDFSRYLNECPMGLFYQPPRRFYN